MTIHNEAVHPRNELKQFTDKAQGAPETALPEPEGPSETRAVLSAQYKRYQDAKRTIILTSAKLAADRLLAEYSDAVYLDFDASDQGENSGLWAMTVTDVDGDAVTDDEDFDDDVTEALQNMPQETQYFEDQPGVVAPRYQEWLDFDADRIDLRAASALPYEDARAALNAAYKITNNSNRAIVQASGKLAAESILADYPGAVYLNFETSDQGEESGLWAITITDADGEPVTNDEDFSDEVAEALSNMPQDSSYFTDDSGQIIENFVPWLDHEAERIDLVAASQIKLGG
jgi:hypothetical protein